MTKDKAVHVIETIRDKFETITDVASDIFEAVALLTLIGFAIMLAILMFVIFKDIGTAKAYLTYDGDTYYVVEYKYSENQIIAIDTDGDKVILPREKTVIEIKKED